MTGVRCYNYCGIADCLKFLINATDGERRHLAQELAQANPELADRLAEMLLAANGGDPSGPQALAEGVSPTRTGGVCSYPST